MNEMLDLTKQKELNFLFSLASANSDPIKTGDGLKFNKQPPGFA
jgi:hypothetical protein